MVQDHPFGIHELAGSVGDFGTILPLVLALAATGALSITPILLFFGVWFIITGFYYRYPIPIEPMKAIAVVAVAESLSGGVIAASGLILGIIFLLLAFTDWLDIMQKYLPESVVRGVQLGLALILLRTAFGYLIPDPLPFVVGAAIIGVGFLLAYRYRIPDLSSIVVIITAFAAGIYIYGLPPFAPPQLISPVIPTAQDALSALSVLVVPQAILTITNAIFATSLLATDLFSAEIKPKKLSGTIGLMNLSSIPFGGMPMCHGAGGFAAQFRFGARTGGANVYAGFILIAFALLFTSPAWLALVSPGFYAALLLFVAIELARHGLKTDSLAVTLFIGILSLAISITVAFFAGLALAWLLEQRERRTGTKKRR
ncbi:MAG: putative sulfate/molybdate transporter [Halobacteriota archaeon]